MLTAPQILALGGCIFLFLLGMAFVVDIATNDGDGIANIFKAMRGK